MTPEMKSAARLLLEADQADRRAAMLDGFASETEGRAYRMGPGSRLYYEALEKVERHRADAELLSLPRVGELRAAARSSHLLPLALNGTRFTRVRASS